jgi:hypothetical protein
MNGSSAGDGDHFDITCSSFQDHLLARDHWAHRRLAHSHDPQTKGPIAGPFPFILRSVSIEQFFEKGLLPLRVTVLMALSIWLSMALVLALMMLWVHKAGLLCWSGGWCVLGASLDDFVEFPAVEPNTTALGAIVNLDALSLTHHERDTTNGTRHTGSTGHRRAS